MNEKSTKKERLQSLLKKVREDGILDGPELSVLKEEMIKDETVSLEEASALFELASELTEEQARDDFEDMYVDGITSYLLYEQGSEGLMETTKWIWLQDRITKDHKYTPLEQALLRNIAQKAEMLPENFHEWLNDLESHLDKFGGDLDELEYKERTSFMAELKALLKRFS